MWAAGFARAGSKTLDALEREGRIAIAGAVYDVATGEIERLTDPARLSDGSDGGIGSSLESTLR